MEDVSLGYASVHSDSEIIELLNGEEAKLICCGHTHIPRSVNLSTGQQVINPGSVGLQAYTDDEPVIHSMENFSPHASYSIVEKYNFGWAVQHNKVPYNIELAVTESKKRNRMDWVHFLKTDRIRQSISFTAYGANRKICQLMRQLCRNTQ